MSLTKTVSAGGGDPCPRALLNQEFSVSRVELGSSDTQDLG